MGQSEAKHALSENTKWRRLSKICDFEEDVEYLLREVCLEAGMRDKPY